MKGIRGILIKARSPKMGSYKLSQKNGNVSMRRSAKPQMRRVGSRVNLRGKIK